MVNPAGWRLFFLAGPSCASTATAGASSTIRFKPQEGGDIDAASTWVFHVDMDVWCAGQDGCTAHDSEFLASFNHVTDAQTGVDFTHVHIANLVAIERPANDERGDDSAHLGAAAAACEVAHMTIAWDVLCAGQFDAAAFGHSITAIGTS